MAITIEQQPEALLSSGNRIYFHVSSNMHNAANYELTAQICIFGDNDTLLELPRMKMYPKSDGKSEIDVSKILHNRLKPVFPDISSKSFSRLLGFTLRFKVIFRETYMTSVVVEKESDSFTVLKAKFPEKSSITDWLESQNYLTNQNTLTETVNGSVHYLVTIFQNEGTYPVKMSICYKDGTKEDRSMGNIYAISPNEIFAIPTGAKHLTFEKEPIRYTIWVQNNVGSTVFRKVTYVVCERSKKNSSLLYLNVLGGIDAIAVSELSETMKTERELYRVNGLNLLSILTDYTDTFEVTTGYITSAAARLCRELVMSEQVCIHHNDALIPINMEKGSYKVYEEDNDLHSLSFKYSFADPSYPVLNDSGDPTEPDPGPEPDGTVLACCPDGIDDYLEISSSIAVLFLYPSASGSSFIYTIDMIPKAGPTFSMGYGAGFYLGFMYTGSGIMFQTVFSGKSYLVYQSTSEDYSSRRVTLKFTVKNVNGTLLFSLLINGLEEVLNVIDDTGGDSQVNNTKSFCRLFNNGIEQSVCGNSQLISLSMDSVDANGNIIPKVLWNFEGTTSEERIKNKISGGSNFNLVPKNIAAIDEIFKNVTYNN